MTDKISETELFMKYKSTYISALIDFSIHMSLIASSFYSVWYFRHSWASVITIPLLGMLHIKTFMIFHDCGHNSYTPNKTLNYMIGLLLSGSVSHPFLWNYNHNTHHNANGNIENEYGFRFNEVVYHTATQYQSMSNLSKMVYKLVRSPAFFFTIPVYVNILLVNQFRVFSFVKRKYDCTVPNPYLFFEQMVSTAGLLLILYACQLNDILLHFLLSFCVGSTMTILVVHNEHTYNPAYVVGDKEWTYRDSGLRGSSFILIPRTLKYFFHGIEYHHIHHMNSKIPGYNLQKYHEDVTGQSTMLDNVTRLSLTDCYRNLWLVLYDENQKKYITFAEADQTIKAC